MRPKKITQNALARRLGASKVDRKSNNVQEDEDKSDASEFDFDNAIPDVTENKVQASQSDAESGSDEDEADRELQIALRDGLLKTDRLNYVVEKKRPVINKIGELKLKFNEFKKDLPWVETLDVVSPHFELDKKIENDDFQRELGFYKQAEKAVQTAVPRLLNMKVKVLRPEDYYAEMAKSDEHMQKVRKRLLSIQTGKERQEAIRRMREEKKFASKVQKEANVTKHTEKKKLAEAVKKHKKGMKQQLEDMLNNVKRMGLDRDEEDEKQERSAFGDGRSRGGRSFRGGGGMRNRSEIKNKFKSDKFGYGGRKKGLKRNNKESFDDVYRGGRGGGGFRGSSRGGSRGGSHGGSRGGSRAGSRGRGRGRM